MARGLEKTVEPGQKAGYIHVEPLIEVHKEPLVVNPSPFVMASSRATLNLIDRNQVISIFSNRIHDILAVHLLRGAAACVPRPVRDCAQLRAGHRVRDGDHGVQAQRCHQVGH